MNIRMLCIAATVVLAGCIDTIPGNQASAPIEARAGSDLPAQRFEARALTEGAIQVTVPAGEWRILRVAGLSGVRLYIASQPQPGAQPYWGVGQGPEGASVSFTAPPQDRTAATAVTGWFRGLAGGPDEIIVLGSNAAATNFAIGYPPPDFDLTGVGVYTNEAPTLTPEMAEDLALHIASRPNVPARFESGAGGYAGTIYHQRVISGEVIEFASGAITLARSALASVEAGATVLGQWRVTGQSMQAGPGAASFIALTLAHSAEVDFDFRYHLPPMDRRQVGAGFGVGGFVPGAGAGLSGLGLLLPLDPGLPDVSARGLIDIKEWTGADPGEAALDLIYNFTGREGTYLSPERNLAEDVVHAFTPDIFWVDWGYVNADLGALYGWTVYRATAVLSEAPSSYLTTLSASP